MPFLPPFFFFSLLRWHDKENIVIYSWHYISIAAVQAGHSSQPLHSHQVTLSWHSADPTTSTTVAFSINNFSAVPLLPFFPFLLAELTFQNTHTLPSATFLHLCI